MTEHNNDKEIVLINEGQTMVTKSSREVNELFTALAKFQSEVPPIERNKTVKVKMRSGGSYSFSYSPLDNTLATIRPVLSKNGLAVSQIFDGDSIITLLTHSSGQWLRSTMPVKLDHDNPQDTGEAITYKRRYSVESIVGISATDDMDANGVAGNTASVEGKKESPSKTPKEKTDQRSQDMNATEAMKYIRDTENENLEGFLSPDEDRKTVLSIWESQVGELPDYLSGGEESEPEAEEEQEEEPPFEPDEDEETAEFNPDDYDNVKDLVTEYTKLKKENGDEFKEKYFDAVQERMKEIQG